MVRLIPRDEKFFELFIKDGEIIVEAARKLEDDGRRLRPPRRAARPRSRPSRSRATRSTTRSPRRLERSFITPFDREDIHELTVHLDDVLDGIQASAETFLIYGVEEPTDEARQMVGILVRPGVPAPARR